MLVDIIFLSLIIISGIIGYFKGFFKELYGILVVFLSMGLALLLKNPVANIISNSFAVEEGNEVVMESLSQYLSPAIALIGLYILLYIILKITVKILVGKDLIPNDPDKFKPAGIGISVLKTTFFLTFISFFLSFTTLTEEFNIYDSSFFAPKVIRLNPPVYNLSEDIKEFYQNTIDVIDIFQSMQKQEELTEEQLDTIKEFIKSDIITDEMIVAGTQSFFENSDIDKSALVIPEEVDMEEVKEGLKQSELYPILKDLYDDEVITDSLIEKIIEGNELTGIDPEDIIALFQD